MSVGNCLLYASISRARRAPSKQQRPSNTGKIQTPADAWIGNWEIAPPKEAQVMLGSKV
ncbi:hypothetical protein BPAE_0024g00690 [Botrytis paeoniae]|uniref:Uncharacterized protein n=1 Tax=Botrytis paeoniae TaxID=278948 RepID=A0A4Z1FV83_9HELO|nr:hypothetical protein BPAE_0024g00690 [Botrytis paeoniae]